MIYPGKVTAIVGGQFGSEAKGLVAAWVANVASLPNMACTTNAGAQAGHTTILADGTKFVCYHLPTIGVLREDSTIYLNAGSIIDLKLLEREIQDVAKALGVEPASISRRVIIHPNAAVITEDDRVTEAGASGTTHLGSTGKGVGAAQANKVMRRPGATIGSLRRANMSNVINGIGRIGVLDLAGSMLSRDTPVTVEIPQGTSLSLNNSEFYPKCTSRDCWVGQGLTDAGIHPSFLRYTIMVCRTFPIRVGHVHDEQGLLVGHSGNFFPGSEELSWEDFPGIEPERTTVTKRVRRIATWSNVQYEESLRLNRPDMVVLTFVNYMPSHSLLMLRVSAMRRIERSLGLNDVTHVYSWGPRVSDLSYSIEEAARHIAPVRETA